MLLLGQMVYLIIRCNRARRKFMYSLVLRDRKIISKIHDLPDRVIFRMHACTKLIHTTKHIRVNDDTHMHTRTKVFSIENVTRLNAKRELTYAFARTLTQLHTHEKKHVRGHMNEKVY